MAVAHGTDKELLLEHKQAIDRHLDACGIPVSYTNVFWGGRSEIKPSEISPEIYRGWLREMEGLMKALIGKLHSGMDLRSGDIGIAMTLAPFRRDG